MPRLAGFVDAGETSWPENWNSGTRCHGWSSTRARDLVVHVLGITPAEPGFRVGAGGARARRPRLGPGHGAHPHGFVTVEARADGTVEWTAPSPWCARART
ncbi:MAG: hypothetical protein H6518_12410 [Microthrixaceae bacterium]|nr:hypothetical protein [Microthrixaceae bacterium]